MILEFSQPSPRKGEKLAAIKKPVSERGRDQYVEDREFEKQTRWGNCSSAAVEELGAEGAGRRRADCLGRLTGRVGVGWTGLDWRGETKSGEMEKITRSCR